MPAIAIVVMLVLTIWAVQQLIAKRSKVRSRESELLRLCSGDQDMAVRLTLHEIK